MELHPWIKFTIALLVFLGIALGTYLYFAPSSNGCPGGTTYNPNPLIETCEGIQGRTVCVLSAFGYTPNPGGDAQGDVYAPRTSLGPWCANAGVKTLVP